MITLVNPLHHYHTPSHLLHVIAKMRRRGPPILRAFHDVEAGDVWHCKEGTHRLRAAVALGVVPVLVPVPWWRTRGALERARYAAVRNAHSFEKVEVRA